MSDERIMRLRGTLARIADGRGPARQMAEEALRQDAQERPFTHADIRWLFNLRCPGRWGSSDEPR